MQTELRDATSSAPPQSKGGAVQESVVRLALDDPDWCAFVDRCPDRLAFHRPAWAGVLGDCYGHRPFALVLTDGSGIAAGLPVVEVRTPLRRRRWVSLPYTDECPPLVRPGADPGVLTRLGAELERAARAAGSRGLEVRAELPSETLAPLPRGFTHVIPLEQDADAVLARCRKGTRSAVRAAERDGITTRVGTARADLVETFYGLHVLTRQRLGVPVQPRRFFELLWERLIAPGAGFVVVAEQDDVPAAAAVFLLGGATVSYKYSASDPRARGSNANNAVLGRAIREACARDYERLDLGRTDFEHTGLRTYKRGWGSEEAFLLYTGTPSAPGRSSRLAQVVIQHSPPAVCRAVGRALYRYAA